MGDLFRSEPMQLVQLFVQIEAAHATVDELGNLGLIQFKDMNPEVSPFQRNFVNEVKRCDEMERKLNFFEEQVNKELKQIQEERGDEQELRLDVLGRAQQERYRDDRKKPQMDELESIFDEQEKELIQLNNNQEQLTRNHNELVELQNMLMKDSVFFSETSNHDFEEREETRGLLSETDASRSVKLGFLTGVILREKVPTFERVLWRATRGNLYLKHDPISGQKIKDPHTGEEVDKDVFIIFFQGERIQFKIKKICESFGANVYPCPSTPRERKELLGQINQRLDDLRNVLGQTSRHRRSTLLDIGRKFYAWKDRVVKEKAIYDTMNRFNYDIGRKCLIAEGWCPKTATDKIVSAMRHATEISGALVPSILSVIQTREEPPTSFKTNKFTSSFQGIVDSYGIAHYGEVNPGVFTIVTFPFLFAVMFGDIGHGFILILVAAFFIWKERQLGSSNLNEMVQTVFDGRYMLLLMGIFSLYTGAIYNEVFSVAVSPFPLQWQKNTTSHAWVPLAEGRYVYPFGVDPTWNGAENSLMYYNSLKMKMSIVLGVTQMTLGIVLSLFNGLHFKKPVDIYCEFVPQIIFIQSIFGYLVFLVFYKWCAVWPNPQSAPFILTTLIQMFLSPTYLAPEFTFYKGQLAIQSILIFLALVSVPWMLLAKPFLLRKAHNDRIHRNPHNALEDEDEHESNGHGGHGGHGEFEFSEIFIHQTIHTIEFVLGCVSNTASYLRLWALSLAHSQLSEVFWGKLFMLSFTVGNAGGSPNRFLAVIAVFIGFAVWAGVTIGVLMVMESLSSFLHALRLHWVEFQNKFFKGDGRAFLPFSYKRILGKPE
eukprot:TRINITY_DN449_c0_g1_i1.p1 TRINITY_DN449_c0_g1~~TRINITY_DN449_c0_g1_i1.p1  ORF type:complete len:838 (-),score=277.96 TRINITY_DN449_c0_g1_i1:63-2540(-)